MTEMHDAMLDDVAVYALGTLPLADAERVRAHLRSCRTCRAEYQALAATTGALAASSEGPAPNELLKARIMREVGDPERAAQRRPRTIVWPAYLVAAACFAVAVTLSLLNLSLMEQLKTAQTRVANMDERSSALVHDLTGERTTVADLMDERAQRFDVPGGQIVRIHNRLYITLHDLAQPPQGKVYQAWTLPKGSKTMQPSLTFVPDPHGLAVVALPVDARITAAVAVSVEPDGGSQAPTSRPLVVEQFD
jgi:anti-sigma-K factor RskA